MDWPETALRSLPEAVAHPLAFAAYLATLIVWVLSAFRTRRLRLLLRHLEGVPDNERSALIKAEMGVVLPERISPRQWIRARSHRYYLTSFLGLCFLLLSLFSIAMWKAHQASTEAKTLLRRVNNLQSQLSGLRNSVDQIKFEMDSLTVRVAVSEKISTLTDQLETTLKQLSQASHSYPELDLKPPSLRAASADVLHNRALQYFQSGSITEAIGTLNEAIEIFSDLVNSENGLFRDQLALTRFHRGLVRFRNGDSRGAAEDLAAAENIYSTLVQVEGRHEFEEQLATVKRNRDFIAGITVGQTGISSVHVTELTLAGFPQPQRILLFPSPWEGYERTLYYGDVGTTILVPPNTYDIILDLQQRLGVPLVKNVRVAQGEQITIEANRFAAALVCDDPGMKNLEIRRILVIDSGTDFEGPGVFPVRQAGYRFGEAILVFAGDIYDVVIEPTQGGPVMIDSGIRPKTGELTHVCGRQG